MMTTELLRRIVGIIGTYVGAVSEVSIKANFSIVYQVRTMTMMMRCVTSR